MQTPMDIDPITTSQSVPLSMRQVQPGCMGQFEGKTIMRNIITTLQSLYAPPTAEAMALRELEQSRRDLLSAQTQQEFSLKMVEFHKIKIKRLTLFLKGMEEQS
jgi:hypothetical protein